mmetsp:Transcript_17894/g.29842  ORF Transcript_17894/g.29842 Transcript_17894/m.29842 type:complete len:171 (-) Transcript_17894:191-703(-)
MRFIKTRASVEYAAPEALLCGPVTPQRISAASFLVPMALCVMQRRPVGTVVLLFVFGTSTVVHRPVAVWVRCWREHADNVAVLFWFLYNAALTIQTVFQLILSPQVNSSGIIKTVAAVTCATVCARLDWYRRTLVFRTWKRDAVHCSIHILGAAGTLLLLLTEVVPPRLR